MILDAVVDDWGSPLVEEKKPAKASHDKVLVESHVRAESTRIQEASERLRDIEDRLDMIGSVLEAEERIQVKAEQEDETQGVIQFKVTINAGDLSRLERETVKNAQADDPEFAEGAAEDALADLFGTAFQKRLNDLIWRKVKDIGEYVGSELELDTYPSKRGEFKASKLTGTLKLFYEHPRLEYGSLEKAIADAIGGLI